MLFNSWLGRIGKSETESERRARIKREERKQKELETERKNKIKEKRLVNRKDVREMSLFRRQLKQLEKDALIDLIVNLRKENAKLKTELEEKRYEVIAARDQGYRQAGEDRYNSLSRAEKDNIQWERDRASDRLVN
ncbi:MAG: hypothetical protein A3G49_05770 [Candidatus Sungbacteria bacterium RIFCSPLOWO2_12_FULL_41_11]|uniref:Uncharacterized protein n=1 Tax=Candidatus Sungbacteria bacterium RIFCSPLOWO2_12_FULL_41_11 TaxID=1802286 RepID=A0A1G2LUT4_9BACT|nr:MAG: hypothetical protein UV01_C0008G0006 [Parcubacteria group bacterium GW2011_GWA2_42_14]OGZ99232.1 MAG: hypothetical protein A3D41_04630 [Candidatus Sungbacteria bacterium RIFCSPHIGHO2_02_FULL_41_12b]OHA14659.1 MAG: hypothetical protein A3G49_05770 [Candidatus Sungbacteria bacterium RIFCSPLOWO2_12_FULL_41_11]